MPSSSAQLLLTIAEQRAVPVAYVTGLQMRRAAELYAGSAKTDPRDAWVLADFARRHGDQLVWLDVSPLEAPPTSPATEKTLTAWRSAGWQVQAHTVAGPAFWQTVGTDNAPALIQATLAALHMPGPTP